MMKRIILLFAASTMLIGCESSPWPTFSSSEPGVDYTITREEYNNSYMSFQHTGVNANYTIYEKVNFEMEEHTIIVRFDNGKIELQQLTVGERIFYRYKGKNGGKLVYDVWEKSDGSYVKDEVETTAVVIAAQAFAFLPPKYSELEYDETDHSYYTPSYVFLPDEYQRDHYTMKTRVYFEDKVITKYTIELRNTDDDRFYINCECKEYGNTKVVLPNV